MKNKRDNRFKNMIDGMTATILVGIFVVTLLSFVICNIIFMLGHPDVFSVVEWIWSIPALLLSGGYCY